MGRKVHVKKIRNREAYEAAKNLGSISVYDTTNGSVLLNVMKHYCLQKPYKNEEYQNIMLSNIKKRFENYKAAQAKDTGSAVVEA